MIGTGPLGVVKLGEPMDDIFDSSAHRPVYHIVMDHAFQVESIVTYHRISPKKCITLSIYKCITHNLKHDFLVQYVEEGNFIPIVLIYTVIVKYL